MAQKEKCLGRRKKKASSDTIWWLQRPCREQQEGKEVGEDQKLAVLSAELVERSCNKPPPHTHTETDRQADRQI